MGIALGERCVSVGGCDVEAWVFTTVSRRLLKDESQPCAVLPLGKARVYLCPGDPGVTDAATGCMDDGN